MGQGAPVRRVHIVTLQQQNQRFVNLEDCIRVYLL